MSDIFFKSGPTKTKKLFIKGEKNKKKWQTKRLSGGSKAPKAAAFTAKEV